jgi:CRISPR/Cas system CMR-associated protein Cmr1 (group 7 of RAMP superfamily)
MSYCYWGFNKEFQQKFREAKLTILHVNETVVFCSLTTGNWMKFKQTGNKKELNPDELDRLREIVDLQENSPKMETEDKVHLFPNENLLASFQRELKSRNRRKKFQR